MPIIERYVGGFIEIEKETVEDRVHALKEKYTSEEAIGYFSQVDPNFEYFVKDRKGIDSVIRDMARMDRPGRVVRINRREIGFLRRPFITESRIRFVL